jgi:hypothetical protein
MFHFIPLVNGIGGVPMECRCRAADAISLHDSDFKRTPENILFPGNKKCRFVNFLRAGAVKKCCSHPVEWRMKPGLLTFGFVSVKSQVSPNMLLRQSRTSA